MDHGTTTSYRKGCRCDECKAAHRRYQETRKEHQRAWREQNKEHLQELQREHYARNRTNLEAQKREWAKRNREAARAHAREWAKRNPERTAAWRAANPDRSREHKREWAARNLGLLAEKAQRRRARMRSLPYERIDRDVVFARDKGRCGICGELVDPHEWDLDHVIPISRDDMPNPGHVYDNVRVSHPECNRWKRDRLDSELGGDIAA